MIRLDNITKVFDKNTESEISVLKDFSFNINKGDNILIQGENGIGKTSLLKIIGTLDKEFVGEYYVKDRNIKNLDKKDISKIRNEFFGFVFQDFFCLKRKQDIII